MPDNTTRKLWQERVDEILSDSSSRNLAALVFYLVRDHLKNCMCTRKCTEQRIHEEAYLYKQYLLKK